MSHGLKFGRRKGETPEQAARGKTIAVAAARLRQRKEAEFKARQGLRSVPLMLAHEVSGWWHSTWRDGR